MFANQSSAKRHRFYIRSMLQHLHRLAVSLSGRPAIRSHRPARQRCDRARVSNRRLNQLRLIRIGAALEVSVATCRLGVLAQPATAAADPVGWQTTFDDEFDGPAGTPPDPGRWQPDIGGTGWGNNELQFYTPRGNVFLDGQGHLVIEARPASANLNCWYGAMRIQQRQGDDPCHLLASLRPL